MPASRIFCLARTSRCAIASSLARKARATCAVVSPQTVRSVSATCTSAAKAGWQQVKISRSMSSSSTLALAGLVGSRRVVQQFVRQFWLLAAKRDLPADPVDRLVASDIDQPGARIGRRIGGGPALQRDREGILQRVLGEIEIADEADQRRQRPTRLVTEYFFDLARGHRTSHCENAVIPGRRKASNLDVQLHIGESRYSGSCFARPGMTASHRLNYHRP